MWCLLGKCVLALVGIEILIYCGGLAFIYYLMKRDGNYRTHPSCQMAYHVVAVYTRYAMLVAAGLWAAVTLLIFIITGAYGFN